MIWVTCSVGNEKRERQLGGNLQLRWMAGEP